MTGIFIRDVKSLCLQVRPLQFNTRMHVCCPQMFRFLAFLPSMFLETKKLKTFLKNIFGLSSLEKVPWVWPKPIKFHCYKSIVHGPIRMSLHPLLGYVSVSCLDGCDVCSVIRRGVL